MEDDDLPAPPVPTPRNTHIEELMEEYANDGFDFSDIQRVKNAALRYVWTMPDSQVRTLLYALAKD